MARVKTSLGGALGFITLIVTTVMAAIKQHGEEVIFSLSEDRVKELTKKFVDDLVQTSKPITTSFRYDKRKDGWELLENTSRRLTTASINGISFLKENESSINGEEMVRRARMELDANYGQEDAEWLLEHQKEIPVELQNFYLPFPGTIWRSTGGFRGVPYLHWFGDQWILYFGWLVGDWSSRGRLVVPRK